MSLKEALYNRLTKLTPVTQVAAAMQRAKAAEKWDAAIGRVTGAVRSADATYGEAVRTAVGNQFAVIQRDAADIRAAYAARMPGAFENVKAALARLTAPVA